jgi:glycogen debranching enzyme
MIELTKRICTNFDQSTSREWLEANGLGGFASSSIAGINTRRYHALLTAATKPPVGRMVLLSKCEETWLSMKSAMSFQRINILGRFIPAASFI